MQEFGPQIHLSPDSPSGPPAEVDQNRRAALDRLIVPMVTKEVHSHGLNPDIGTFRDTWKDSNEYKQAIKDAGDLWRSQAASLGLPEEGGVLIAESALDVWWAANHGEVDNKEVDVGWVEGELAQMAVIIESLIGDNQTSQQVIKDVIERMIDQANSPQANRKLSEEVRWNRVENKIRDIKTENEKSAIEREERERFEERAKRISTLKPSAVKELRATIVNNWMREESEKVLPQQMFVGEAQVALGLNDEELNSKQSSYWFEVVDRALEMQQDPEIRQQFRQRIADIMKIIEQEQGKTSVEKYLTYLREEIVTKPRFTGEMPSVDLVPVGLSLRSAAEDITHFAEQYDVDVGGKGKRKKKNGSADKVKQMLMTESLLDTDAASLDQLRGFMPMAMRDLEMYLMVNETAEAVVNARDLEERRMVWAARVFGTMMRGGSGYARFYAQAIGGDEGAPSIEGPFGKGLQWVGKMDQAKGYHKREHFHEAFGFFSPEELSALMEASIPITAWVKDSDLSEPREVNFTLSSKDVLGRIYKSEVLSELKANKGLGAGSHSEAKGKWMMYTILYKMGYSTDQLDDWFNTIAKHKQTVETLINQGKKADADILEKAFKNPLPEIVRTNQVSFSTTLEINSLDLLAGENWWMMMQAYDWVNWTRGDYMLLPIDEVKRRELLALRDILGDYYRFYASVEPPFQLVHENALLPSLLDLSVKKALLEPMQELLTAQEGIDKQIITERKELLEKLIVVDQVSPSAARTLGAAAMGLGSFEMREGEIEAKLGEWENLVDGRMSTIETLEIKKMRPPELWSKADLGLSEVELKRIWEGKDFSEALRECGLHEIEVMKLADQGKTVGSEGWKLFLENANVSLFDLEKLIFKDMDSSNRYPEKAHNVRMQMIELSKVEIEGYQLHEGKQRLTPTIADLVGRKEYDFKDKGRDHPPIIEKARENIFQQHGKWAKELKEVIQKIDFSGFSSNLATHRIYEAALWMWVNANVGWEMNETSPLLVEDIEVKKVDAGDHYGVKRIVRGEHKALWAEHLGLSVGSPEFEKYYTRVTNVLEKHGFYFASSAEMSEDEAILIGPNSGFVPAVIKPAVLIDKLIEETSKRISKDGDSINGIDAESFGNRLATLKKNGVFCWNTLFDDQANVTALEAITYVLRAFGSSNRIPAAVARRIHGDLLALESEGLTTEWMYVGGYRARVVRKELGQRLYDYTKPYTPSQMKWDVELI